MNKKNSSFSREYAELCSGRGSVEDKKQTKALINANLIWSTRAKSLTLQRLKLKSLTLSSARHIEKRLSTLDSDSSELRNFSGIVRMRQR